MTRRWRELEFFSALFLNDPNQGLVGVEEEEDEEEEEEKALNGCESCT